MVGLLPYASNYTYLANLCPPEGEPSRVVYKPRSGESPLWDFPEGTLCLRETAAYLVSEAGGWGFVPRTVVRDGPLGIGAVQEFVTHDPRITAFELLDSHPGELRAIALFDFVSNNADRKAGHVLRDSRGKVWAVDHGICFHVHDKLRTVIWDFAGERIDQSERRTLQRLITSLDSSLRDDLDGLLTTAEMEAMRMRAHFLLEGAVFPAPGPGRRHPWPPV